MRFERGRDVKESLNIGRIRKAYRATYIRAVVNIYPVYYYGAARTGKPVDVVSIGVVLTEEDFIKDMVGHWDVLGYCIVE